MPGVMRTVPPTSVVRRRSLSSRIVHQRTEALLDSVESSLHFGNASTQDFHDREECLSALMHDALELLQDGFVTEYVVFFLIHSLMLPDWNIRDRRAMSPLRSVFQMGGEESPHRRRCGQGSVFLCKHDGKHAGGDLRVCRVG